MPTFTFTGPNGRSYSVEGPDGATPEQAFQVLQTQLGSQPDTPPAPPAAAPDRLTDAAKSVGAGLANATAGTLGFVGDVRDIRNNLVSGAANKLGIPQGVQDAVAGIVNRSPLGIANLFPTSKQVLEAAPEPIVDPNFKPETAAGGYLKTAAEFLPGMAVGGPRGVLPKLLTNVAAPAVASETAGLATEGTAAEPYARIAAALTGSAGASKAVNAVREARAIKAATPTLSDVKTEASKAYDALTSRNVATPISQSVLDNLADDITSTLNNRGIRPSTAQSIHNAIAEIRSSATAGAADAADLVAARQSVKGLLGSPDANKTGAVLALQKIEQAIEQSSPGTMRAIKEADKNYASFKAAEGLDKRVAKAELRAAGENSGANVGNKIRQNVTNLLTSNEAKYLSAETKADLEKIVRGTMTQNAVRTAANILGGGGGLGMLAGGAAGYQAGGWPAAVAGAAAGKGLKIVNNRSVTKQAERVAEAIRRRSPLGQQAPLALPKPANPVLTGLLAALLARPQQ